MKTAMINVLQWFDEITLPLFQSMESLRCASSNLWKKSKNLWLTPMLIVCLLFTGQSLFAAVIQSYSSTNTLFNGTGSWTYNTIPEVCEGDAQDNPNIQSSGGQSGAYLQIFDGYGGSSAAGQWFPVSDLDLTTGVDYVVSLYYQCVDVGTVSDSGILGHDYITVFVATDSGSGSAYDSRVDYTPIPSTGPGSTVIDLRENIGTNMAAIGWTEWTSTGTFQLFADDDYIFIGVEFEGWGANAGNPVTNFDYFGIDEISIDEDSGSADTLPFTETFETNPVYMAGTIGSVSGQHGWVAAPYTAGVVQASVFNGGSQAMVVTNGTASHAFSGCETNVWVWHYVQPAFGDTASFPSNASAVYYFNSASNIVMYDGATPKTNASVIATNGNWSKIMLHLNYTNHTWSLWYNDDQVTTNYSFYSNVNCFAELGYTEGDGTRSYVDDINVVITNPLDNVSPRAFDFNVDGGSWSDAQMASGITITGLVFDGESGIANNADYPSYQLNNTTGIVAVSSNVFSTAPANGATTTGAVSDVAAGVSAGRIETGTWTAVVNVEDVDGNRSISNWNFTVTDDDTTGPDLYGFTFDGAVYTNDASIGGGVMVSGMVVEASDGLYTSLVYLSVWNPNNVQLFTNQVFTNNNMSGDGDTTARYLGFLVPSNMLDVIGTYTVRVQAADYDNDRTIDRDTTISISNFTFIINEEAPPVLTGFNIDGTTVTDADLAGGFAVTGLVQDIGSGIRSDTEWPNYRIYNATGRLVVASNIFSTAPADGGAKVSREALADAAFTPAADEMCLGTWSGVVAAVDKYSSPLVNISNMFFTVVDDDTNEPSLFGFSFDGRSYVVGSSVNITGLVEDASGVFYQSNTLSLWAPGANQIITNVLMTNDMVANGAATTGSPEGLRYLVDSLLIDAVGVYTVYVAAVDFDVDRPGDALTMSTTFTFSIVPPSTQYWGGGTVDRPDGTPPGYTSGAWNATTLNWADDAAGTTYSAWLGGWGDFGTSNAIVTLETDISAQGLIFHSSNGQNRVLTGSSLRNDGNPLHMHVHVEKNVSETYTLGTRMRGDGLYFTASNQVTSYNNNEFILTNTLNDFSGDIVLSNWSAGGFGGQRLIVTFDDDSQLGNAGNKIQLAAGGAQGNYRSVLKLTSSLTNSRTVVMNEGAMLYADNGVVWTFTNDVIQGNSYRRITGHNDGEIHLSFTNTAYPSGYYVTYADLYIADTSLIDDTLQVGNGGGVILEKSGTIASGLRVDGSGIGESRYIVNAGQTVTFEGEIVEYLATGSMTKQGEGTMVIADSDGAGSNWGQDKGNFIYIQTGALWAANASGSAFGYYNIQVEADGELGGNGIIEPWPSNAVYIAGTLAPGTNSADTLTFNFSGTNKLNFEAGSTLDFDVGSQSDMVNFTTVGDWLNGTNEMAALHLNLGTGFDYTNTYTVFTNVTTTGFVFGSISGYSQGAYSALVQKAGNAYVLSFTNYAIPGTQYWGGGTVDIADGTPVGYTNGTWNWTTKNWANDATGTTYSSWRGGWADFGTSNAVVNISGDIMVQGMIFDETGGEDHTFVGDSLLGDGDMLNIRVNEISNFDKDITIASRLRGPGLYLYKTNTGGNTYGRYRITLSNVLNDFTGNIVLTNNSINNANYLTLSFNDDAQLGNAANEIILDGNDQGLSELEITADIINQRVIHMGADARLVVDNATWTFNDDDLRGTRSRGLSGNGTYYMNFTTAAEPAGYDVISADAYFATPEVVGGSVSLDGGGGIIFTNSGILDETIRLDGGGEGECRIAVSAGRTVRLTENIFEFVDSYDLTKQGAGTLIVADDDGSSWGGAGAFLYVQTGTVLIANTSGRGMGYANIQVDANATLGGDGIIHPLASNIVEIAGTLAPGTNGAGTLTFNFESTSTLSFVTGAVVELDLGTASDLIEFETSGDWLRGTNGYADLQLTLGAGFSYASTYTVFTNVTTAGFVFGSISGYDSTNYIASVSKAGSRYVLSFISQAPYAETYSVGVGNQITDAQMSNGQYAVSLRLTSPGGITNDATAPNYDILNDSGTVVVTNLLITNFSYTADGSFVGTNNQQGLLPYTAVELGTNVIRWTAVASSGVAETDSTLLSNGTALTFTVVDDDTIGPDLYGFTFDGAVYTNDASILGGVWITGMVEEATDGLYTSLVYLSVWNPNSVQLFTNQVFTNNNMSGDGDTAARYLDFVVPSNMLDVIGIYTVRVQAADYDNDRDVDLDTAISISNFTFYINEEAPPVLTGFNIDGTTVTDGDLVGGFAVTGLVQDIGSGIRSDGDWPNYAIYNATGDLIVASNSFSTAPADGDAKAAPEALADDAFTPPYAHMCLGTWSGVVAAVDKYSSPLVNISNMFFTVVDDDTNEPSLFGFSFDGRSYVVGSSVNITGLVEDASGVFYQSNTLSLWAPGANQIITNVLMTNDMVANGAATTGSPEGLRYLVDSSLIDAVGVYTVYVAAVDFDNDRPGDALTTSSSFTFSIVTPSTQYWGGGTVDRPDGTPPGYTSGTWNATTQNWADDAAGTTYSAWLGGWGDFGTSNAIVTLETDISAQGLIFHSSNGQNRVLTGSSLRNDGNPLHMHVHVEKNVSETYTLGTRMRGDGLYFTASNQVTSYNNNEFILTNTLNDFSGDIVLSNWSAGGFGGQRLIVTFDDDSQLGNAGNKIQLAAGGAQGNYRSVLKLTSSLTNSRTVVMNEGAMLYADNGVVWTFTNDVIQGNSYRRITGHNDGEIHLSFTNTAYPSGYYVTYADLYIADTSLIDDTLQVGNGGGVILEKSGTIASGLRVESSGIGESRFVVATGQTVTFEGTIVEFSANADMTKQGEGTMVIADEDGSDGNWGQDKGNFIYIQTGALWAANASGSAFGYYNIQVEADGELGGNGIIEPWPSNAVYIAGTLAPGTNSADTLEFNFTGTNKVHFQAGSVVDFDVGSQSDLIHFTTEGDWLNGTNEVAALNLNLGAGFSYDDSYVLMTNVTTAGFTFSDITGHNALEYDAGVAQVGNTYVLSFVFSTNNPFASNYTVDGDDEITDEQMKSGAYEIGISFWSLVGITNEAATPNYDVLNASGTVVIADQTLTSLAFSVDGESLYGTNAVQSPVSTNSIFLGTNSLRWTATSSNGVTRTDELSLSNGNSLVFTVVDDDDTGPALSGFALQGQIYTNDAGGLGSGIWITGMIQDAVSGIYTSELYFSLIAPNGDQLMGSTLFTNSIPAHGDTNQWTLSFKMSTNYFRDQIGIYTALVTAADYDRDRPLELDKAVTVTSITFTVAEIGPPRFYDFNIDGTTIYDYQWAGGFVVSGQVQDIGSGIFTNANWPYFYIKNSTNDTLVIASNRFANAPLNGGAKLSREPLYHTSVSLPAAQIPLGTWTALVAAVDIYTPPQYALSNMHFEVIDEDTEGPVFSGVNVDGTLYTNDASIGVGISITGLVGDVGSGVYGDGASTNRPYFNLWAPDSTLLMSDVYFTNSLSGDGDASNSTATLSYLIPSNIVTVLGEYTVTFSALDYDIDRVNDSMWTHTTYNFYRVPPLGAAALYWGGGVADIANGTPLAGGDGTWDYVIENWANDTNGTTYSAWGRQKAVFVGSNGTISVDGYIDVEQMMFKPSDDDAAYTFINGSIGAGDTGLALHVDATVPGLNEEVDVTILSTIAGTGPWQITANQSDNMEDANFFLYGSNTIQGDLNIKADIHRSDASYRSFYLNVTVSNNWGLGHPDNDIYMGGGTGRTPSAHLYFAADDVLSHNVSMRSRNDSMGARNGVALTIPSDHMLPGPYVSILSEASGSVIFGFDHSTNNPIWSLDRGQHYFAGTNTFGTNVIFWSDGTLIPTNDSVLNNSYIAMAIANFTLNVASDITLRLNAPLVNEADTDLIKTGLGQVMHVHDGSNGGYREWGEEYEANPDSDVAVLDIRNGTYSMVCPLGSRGLGKAAILVRADGTLAGTFTHKLDDASNTNNPSKGVRVYGTLAPGTNSAGTMDFVFTNSSVDHNQLVFYDGAVLEFDVGTESDLIQFAAPGDWVAGSTNLLLMLNTNNTGFSYANSYTIFSNLSTAGLTFDGIAGYDTVQYTATVNQVGAEYILSFQMRPFVTNVAVGMARQLYDAELTGGVYTVSMSFYNAAGMSNNASLPDFDMINAAGTTVINNELFTQLVYRSAGTTLTGSNDVHALITPVNAVLGVYTMRWSAVASNGIEVIDSREQFDGSMITFDVLDDDTNAPVQSGFTLAGQRHTNDMTIGAGVVITGYVQDAFSGINTGQLYFTLIAPNGVELMSATYFTNSIPANGDTNMWAVSYVMPSNLFTQVGSYTAQVTVADFDRDRTLAADSASQTVDYVFTIVAGGPPQFYGFSVDGKQLTDAQMAAGFAVTGFVWDTDSGVSNNSDGPYHLVINATGATVVASNTFDIAPINGGAQLAKELLAEPAFITPVGQLALGVWTAKVGAADTIGNFSESNFFFTVVDDDTEGPVQSSISIDGSTYRIEDIGAGIDMTGQVQDVSGVCTGYMFLSLYSPDNGLILADMLITNHAIVDPDESGLQDIAYLMPSNLFTNGYGTYTAVVDVADSDRDRGLLVDRTNRAYTYTFKVLINAPYAYEGFENYSGWLGGNSGSDGEFGWSGAWEGSNICVSITNDPGLRYFHPSGIVVPGGSQAISITNVYSIAAWEDNTHLNIGLRRLANAISYADNNSIYISFLMQYKNDPNVYTDESLGGNNGAYLSLDDEGFVLETNYYNNVSTVDRSAMETQLFFGAMGYGAYDVTIGITNYQSTYAMPLTVAVSNHFFVARFDADTLAGWTNAVMYINPSNPTNEEADVVFEHSMHSGWSGWQGDLSQLNIWVKNLLWDGVQNDEHILFDEIRIGPTWSSVVPTGAVQDTEGPVFSNVNLSSSVQTDADIAQGLVVTGLLWDALSGIRSNNVDPMYSIRNATSTWVILNRHFAVSPVQGDGKLTPAIFEDTAPPIAWGQISLGNWWARLTAYDAAGTPNMTETNYFFAVVDDDTNAPVISAFSPNGLRFTNDISISSGILLTGIVEDAGSGIATGEFKFTVIGPESNVLISAQYFTNSIPSNAALGAHGFHYTIGSNLLTVAGTYTVRINVMDHDNDRGLSVDALRATNVYTFIIRDTVPYASAYRVGTFANQVTDAQLTAGTYRVQVDLVEEDGVTQNAATPSYRIVRPDNSTAIGDTLFTNSLWLLAPDELRVWNDRHAGIDPLTVSLGVWTMRWTAASQDGPTNVLENRLISNQPQSFSVVDDDTNGPALTGFDLDLFYDDTQNIAVTGLVQDVGSGIDLTGANVPTIWIWAPTGLVINGAAMSHSLGFDGDGLAAPESLSYTLASTATEALGVYTVRVQVIDNDVDRLNDSESADYWTTFNVRDADDLLVHHNGGVTNITTTSAVFRAALFRAGSSVNAEVRLYWGSSDGGTNHGLWQNVVVLDNTGTPGEEYEHFQGGLDSRTFYYYRAYATNSSGEETWADTSDGFLTQLALIDTIVATYYVPFPEDFLKLAFDSIAASDQAQVNNEFISSIAIVASVSNTIIYYDHHEDGYEENPTEPLQSTTEIWGDNDPANGIPPNYAVDFIEAGDVLMLSNVIVTPRNPAIIQYDGSDKFMVDSAITASRAGFMKEPGPVLAGGTQIYETDALGFDFAVSVGTNASYFGGGIFGETSFKEQFTYNSVTIMAVEDGTVVRTDIDDDGSWDNFAVLDEGENHTVDNVMMGTRISASRPIQVQLITGELDSNFESRWFTLYPEEQWSDEYWTPVCSFDGSAASVVSLFNPNTNTISVYWQNRWTTGSFDIPAGTNYALQVGTNTATRFWTTNEMVFLGKQFTDVAVQNYDWGNDLLARKVLTTLTINGIGWGSEDFTYNANPVWVAGITGTTIYVDYDGDVFTGPLLNDRGWYYDEEHSLEAFEVLQVFDQSGDNDQTGMRVYTLDGTALVTAWGEASQYATPNNPFLDMGFTMIPFPTALPEKQWSLVDDIFGNDVVDPGDTIRFKIDITRQVFDDIADVTLFDDMVEYLVYVTNTVTVGGNLTNDNTGLQTAFPLDENGLNIGPVPLGSTTTVEYLALVTNVPSSVNRLRNTARVEGQSSTVFVPLQNYPFMNMFKSNSPSGSSPLPFGYTNPIVYTITLVNTQNTEHTVARLSDPLPYSTRIISNSTQVTVIGPWQGSVYDEFELIAYDGSDGAIAWLGNWQEYDNTLPPSASDGNAYVVVDAPYGILQGYTLNFRGTAEVFRALNLGSTGYTSAVLRLKYRQQLSNANDRASIRISSDGGTNFTELISFAGPALNTNYITYTTNIFTHLSSNMVIKFAVTNWAGISGSRIHFDDVEGFVAGVDVVNQGGDPPLIFQDYRFRLNQTGLVEYMVSPISPPLTTQIVNRAFLASSEAPLDLIAAVTNRVSEQPDLRADKRAFGPFTREFGESITYEITISNAGNIVESSISLSDVIPVPLAYESNSLLVLPATFATNVSAPPSMLNNVTLNPSDFVRITFTSRIAQTYSGLVTNRARMRTLLRPGGYWLEWTNAINDLVLTQGLRSASTFFRDGMQLAWQGVSTGEPSKVIVGYDLLYQDKMNFSDIITNDWMLLETITNSFTVDKGGTNILGTWRPHPTNLNERDLRFYRVAPQNRWKVGNNPRAASRQVYVAKKVSLKPGQNWVALPGVPDTNTIEFVVGTNLPASSMAHHATKISWYRRDAYATNATTTLATQEVWLADSGQWKYSIPSDKAGFPANHVPLNLMDGFIVELPTGVVNGASFMTIGKVRTNEYFKQIQEFPGNYGATNYSLFSFNMPRHLHPSQMSLRDPNTGRGFRSSYFPDFRTHDVMWKFNKDLQVPDKYVIYSDWYGDWVTAGGLPIPTNYFGPDEGIVIMRPNTDEMMVWTNNLIYSDPTRDISP